MINEDISSSVMIFSGSFPLISVDGGSVVCCVDCWVDSVGTVAGGYFVEFGEVDSYSPEVLCVSFEEAVNPSGIYRLSQPVRKNATTVMRRAVN